MFTVDQWLISTFQGHSHLPLSSRTFIASEGQKLKECHRGNVGFWNVNKQTNQKPLNKPQKSVRRQTVFSGWVWKPVVVMCTGLTDEAFLGAPEACSLWDVSAVLSLIWSCFLYLWENLTRDVASTCIPLSSSTELRTALQSKRASKLRCQVQGSLLNGSCPLWLIFFFFCAWVLLNFKNLLALLLASVSRCWNLCSADCSLPPLGLPQLQVVPFVSFAI